MNNDWTRQRLAEVALGALAVGGALYWRRQYQQLRHHLAVSREWDEHARRDDASYTPPDREESDDSGASMTLAIAAKRADTSLSELPERIEELLDETDEQKTEIKRLRKNWSRWWTQAYERGDGDGGSDRVDVVFADLSRGGMDDAKWLAKQLLAGSKRIGFINASGDQAFAIAVTDDLTDEYSAAELAEEVTDSIDGGGGGDENVATGGGSDSEAIAAALRDTAGRVRDESSEMPSSATDS